MTIRFKDFRDFNNYGKEIYTTDNPADARKYMELHKSEMRFLMGGGKTRNGEHIEIYWDVVTP